MQSLLRDVMMIYGTKLQKLCQKLLKNQSIRCTSSTWLSLLDGMQPMHRLSAPSKVRGALDVTWICQNRLPCRFVLLCLERAVQRVWYKRARGFPGARQRTRRMSHYIIEHEWKRKIMANPPCGKCRSRRAELKTVKPEKCVKEHPNEPLTVSNGSKLFLPWHTGIMGTFFSIIGTFLEN